MQNGNLILKSDSSFSISANHGEPLTINSGGLVLQGDRIRLNSVKVQNATGRGVIFSGARYSHINTLTINGSQKEGLTFEEPVFGGEGTPAVPAEGNAVDKMDISSTHINGIRLDDGVKNNTLKQVKVHGNTGGPGIYYGKGAFGNEVDVVEVAAIPDGAAIQLQDASNNRVTQDFNQDPDTTGFIYGAKGPAILVVGNGSEGNQFTNLRIGVSPQAADATTGNGEGIHLQDGANHNFFQPRMIRFSQGDGIAMDGVGTNDNQILGFGTQVPGGGINNSGGSGFAAKNGASGNVVDQQWFYQNASGIHFSTGADDNDVTRSAIYQNAIGIRVDGGATNNNFSANGIFGNTGDAVVLRGDGTAGNYFHSNLVGFGQKGWKNWLPPGVDLTQPNGGNGFSITGGASSNFIGSLPPDRDTTSIAGNALNGILIDGAGSDGNIITSAIIGVDADNKPAPNRGGGVMVSGGAQENMLGWSYDWDNINGQHFTDDLKLVISNSGTPGVVFTGAGTTDNMIVAGSFINSSTGILINNEAADNVIGIYHTSRLVSTGNPRPPTVDLSGNGTAIDLESPGNLILNAQLANFGALGVSDGNAMGVVVGKDAPNTQVSLSDFSAVKNDALSIHSDNNWIDQNNFGPENGNIAEVYPGNGVGIRLTDGASGNVLGLLNSTVSGGFTSLPTSNRINLNGDGILLEGEETKENEIRNNIIGGDFGLRSVSNNIGVHVSDSSENVIGGEFGDFSINFILGSTTAGVKIEGLEAEGNQIGDNEIGRKSGENGIGVWVDDAQNTKIGGDLLGSEGIYSEYGNQIFYNTQGAIKITGAGPTGTTVLDNETAGNGGTSIIDRSDGPVSPGPPITALSPSLVKVALDPQIYPQGGLFQAYWQGATGEAPDGSQYPPDHTVLAASEFIKEPGTSIVQIPAFAPNGAQLVATVTDPFSGATSPMSAPAAPNAQFASPGLLQVVLPANLPDATVKPGQAGVTALALDLTATGNVVVTGLRFDTGGSGDEAAAVSRVRIGIATRDTFSLDDAQPLLADYPGYPRNDATLDHEEFQLKIADGETKRLLVVYDFTSNAPDGVYTVSGMDGGALTAITAESLETAAASGNFPLTGPKLTVSGNGNPPPVFKTGDVNGDGAINIQDVVLMLQVIAQTAQVTAEQLKAADLNGDGTFNVQDVVFCLRVIAGLEVIGG